MHGRHAHSPSPIQDERDQCRAHALTMDIAVDTDLMDIECEPPGERVFSAGHNRAVDVADNPAIHLRHGDD